MLSASSFAQIQYLLSVHVIVKADENGPGSLSIGRPWGKCAVSPIYNHRGAEVVGSKRSGEEISEEFDQVASFSSLCNADQP